MIEIARDLIVTEVDDVALRHPNLPQNIKNKVRSTKQLIEHFKKIGDLYEYMKRFRSIPEHGHDETYDSFKELGLKAYEDIYPIFEEKFKYYLNDITTLDEFVIGGTYTSWDISIFSK
ncbi:MAG: hypothetical protein OWR52_14335 [Acidibacillus sp.]|nr:hypothetical protein [Acidibacillus sp.]